MTTNAVPSWITEARQLYPELLDRFTHDAVRAKNLETALEFFPRDVDKLNYLAYCHQQQLAPDDPAVVATIKLLSILVFMNEHRLEPSLSTLTDQAQNITTVVQTANGDMAKFARILTRQSEKVNEATSGLSEALAGVKQLIGNIGTVLDEATQRRLEEALKSWHHLIEERATEVIEVKTAPMIAMELEAKSKAVVEAMNEVADRAEKLSSVTVQARDLMKPLVDAVNGMADYVPVLDKVVKVPKMQFRAAILTALIALPLGGLIGWSLHQPQPSFTATPDVVRAMEAGANLLQIENHLKPSTLQDINQNIRLYVKP